MAFHCACNLNHKDCGFPFCKSGTVEEQVKAELEEARAEIEQLKRAHRAHEDSNLKMLAKLKAQAFELAAEQAKNVELRGVLKTIYEDFDCDKNAHDYGTDCRCCIAEKAISTPPDTSALEAMIAKAGEKMQERCADVCLRMIAMRSDGGCFNEADDCYESIRALPAVTLEDLK